MEQIMGQNSILIDVRMWVGKENKEAEVLLLHGIPWKGYAANKAYEYARKVLKKRWAPGEKLILEGKFSHTAYLYSKFVIGGRWLEAEDIIADCAHSSWLYSKYILKDRFPKFEKNLENGSNSNYYYRDTFNYAVKFLKSRLPKKAEKSVSTTGVAAEYAAKFMKRRWHAAEKTILNNEKTIEIYVRSLPPKDLKKFRVKLLAKAMTEPKESSGWGYWYRPASSWIQKNEESENPVVF